MNKDNHDTTIESMLKPETVERLGLRDRDPELQVVRLCDELVRLERLTERDKGALWAYRALHDCISDMVEGGRLTAADCPDDYQAVVTLLMMSASLDSETTSDQLNRALGEYQSGLMPKQEAVDRLLGNEKPAVEEEPGRSYDG